MIELGSIQIIGISGIKVITDLYFEIKPNEHAVARIKAVFSKENIDIKDKSIVKIMDSETGTNLFSGYLSKICDNNGEDRLEKIIELISCSIDFDLKPYKRSFQNSGESYESIYNKIANQVKGGRVLCGSECSKPIGSVIYQYEETNWQLIKRLAGDLKVSIYPDTSSDLPSIYIGTTNQAESSINDCLEYSEGASDRYFSTGAHSLGKDISLYRFFRVKTYDNIKIGSSVQFKKIHNRVISKKAYSKKNEIIFEYILGQTELGVQNSFVNLEACGAVLKGTVLDVGTETLKVSLDIDKEYVNSVHHDYPYLSITNNMLYCMPEKDTKVYLNLNDPKGSEARVISCSRTNGDECSDTKVPVNKTFMVPSGMTFKMNGGNIDFISSKNAKNTWSLNTIDKSGINLNTVAKFNLTANKGNIYNKSNTFNLKSPFDITCSDGNGGEINIFGTIEISGNDVAVKAEGRMKFSPINDAPKEIKITPNKFLKLALKFLVAAAVVAVACVVAVALAPATIAAGAVVAGVIGASVLGGAIYAGVLVHDQIKSDRENGITRSAGDYIYMGLDKFCTGAILSAPTTLSPLIFPLKLLGVAGASYIYQKTDELLDNQFGGDFYDSDSSTFGTILLDVASACIAEGLTRGLGGIFKGISNKYPYLEQMNRTAARQYLRKVYGASAMHTWKEFLAQTAKQRGIYQSIKNFILNDSIKSILSNTPANELTNRDDPFKPNDYEEMGDDIYFIFNDQTGDLELIPVN